jgi:hypothetical protein
MWVPGLGLTRRTAEVVVLRHGTVGPALHACCFGGECDFFLMWSHCFVLKNGAVVVAGHQRQSSQPTAHAVGLLTWHTALATHAANARRSPLHGSPGLLAAGCERGAGRCARCGTQQSMCSPNLHPSSPSASRAIVSTPLPPPPHPHALPFRHGHASVEQRLRVACRM